MTDRDQKKIAAGPEAARRRRHTGLPRVSLVALIAAGGCLIGSNASAQTAPSNLVSVCSGVSLPRSVITDTIAPVVTGIVTPVQTTVNPILGLIGAALPLVPPLGIDAAGLLANAAAQQPVTLQVLNANGQVVAPTDQCDAQADSFTLDTPAGVAIGGNRITGLGATGQEANAGEINSVAIGNTAATDPTATNAVALGTGATVGANTAGSMALGAGANATGTNSVALGAGSTATRGNAQAAGEVSVGAPGAERQITNVAAGTAPTDAANLGQVQDVAGQVAALNDRAVQYDGPARDRVTLGGAAGTTLANVAPGLVDPASTEAVNGAQLFATNQAVGGNTTAITNLTTNINNGAVGPVRYSDPANPAVPNAGVPTNDVTLVGAAAAPVGLHNVADGAIAAGSTDAVNGGQVFTLAQGLANTVNYTTDAAGNRTNNVTLVGGTPGAGVTISNVADGIAPTDAANVGQLQAVAGQITALGDRAVQYDDAARDRVTLGGAAGTTLTNVAPGTVAAASTDAVNGGQLFATNQAVDANTTAITNLGNGGAGPVRYSDPGTPTTPNGGVPTNDLTLVGAAAAPVVLHNVGNGTIAAGSTDAVNGGQVFALAQGAVNAVTYDTDAAGNRVNRVTLAGGTAGAPVQIGNVAAGTVAVGSTEAVNGGQLAATNAAVGNAQTTAGTALALGQNSVQYDGGRGAVTLNPGGAAATIRNVGPGTTATDAVNLGQLNSGLAGAVGQANGYTDLRIQAINYDLRRARRDAYAGTAGALAAAGMPQAFGAGRGMIAFGAGTYRSQSAFAVGFSKAFDDGHTVMRLAGTYDTRGGAGASGGVGYQF